MNGLRMHLLEAGQPGNPCLLLLHGFPELAYSWRKVMPALAAAGYHVIAPDQRGYGRTTGWDADYDGEVASFRTLNLVRDIVGLLGALEIGSVKGVIGHDAGAAIAALVRAAAPRPVPLGHDDERAVRRPTCPVHAAGQRHPRGTGAVGSAAEALPVGITRPAKRILTCCIARRACMRSCAATTITRARIGPEQAVPAGGLDGRSPRPDADLLHHGPARRYAETVAKEMPGPEAIAACAWLPDHDFVFTAVNTPALAFKAAYSGTVAAPRDIVARTVSICWTHNRCSFDVHRRCERLGYLPGAGRD